MSGHREGPGHYVAAGIRLDARDIREGHIEWRGATVGECRECGRRIFSLQFDGLCNATSCGGDAEWVREQNRRANEKALAAQRRRWPNGVGR
jgi:hypothetical protein